MASAAVATIGKPVKVETAILRGDPATALIAESRDAAMVCVGSTGIGRFARALLGSTVAELAEAAHCPVAIIRTQQQPAEARQRFDRGRGERFTRQRRRRRAGDQRGSAASRTGPCARRVATRHSVRCPVTNWTGGSTSGSGAIPASSSTLRSLPEPGSPTSLTLVDSRIQLAVIGSTDIRSSRESHWAT